MSGIFPTPPSFSAIYENEIAQIKNSIHATGGALHDIFVAQYPPDKLAAAIVQANSFAAGLKILFGDLENAKATYKNYADAYQAAYTKWQADVKSAIEYIKNDLRGIDKPKIKLRATYIKDGRFYDQKLLVTLPMRGLLESNPFPEISTPVFGTAHQYVEGTALYFLFLNETTPDDTGIEYVNEKYYELSAMLRRYFDVLAFEFGVSAESARAIFEPFYQTYLLECFTTMPYEKTFSAIPHTTSGAVVEWQLPCAPVESIKYLFETAFPTFEAAILNGAAIDSYNMTETEKENILILEYLRQEAPQVFAETMLYDFGIDVAQAQYQKILQPVAMQSSGALGRPYVVGYSWGDFKKDVKKAWKQAGDAITNTIKKLSAIFLPDALEKAINRGIRFTRSIMPLVFPSLYISNNNFAKVRLAYQKYIGNPLQRTFIPDDLYQSAKTFEQKHRQEIKIVGAIIVCIFAAAAVGAIAGAEGASAGAILTDAAYATGDWFMGLAEIGVVQASAAVMGTVGAWQALTVGSVADEKIREEITDKVDEILHGKPPVDAPPEIVIPNRSGGNALPILGALASAFFLTR